MRNADYSRTTSETKISLRLSLDGTGRYGIECPVGFLTHMLETFARHGLFDLYMTIEGDLQVDQHHTVEDTGIALGEAFKAALGDKRGIERAGSFLYPMDEALCEAAIDLCGRPSLSFTAEFSLDRIGEFQTDVVQDFFQGFAQGCACALHVGARTGRSDHHKVEGMFKAFARALRAACAENPRIAGQVPSTKGSL
jgi:imidazoleglycerol-phosphate dehydratase